MRSTPAGTRIRGGRWTSAACSRSHGSSSTTVSTTPRACTMPTRFVILTSDDGRQWTQRYDNQGRHFGGISGAPPLEVVFREGELQARFVRLQIPSRQPIFFHLDEVEIYGPGDAPTNLALHQPADQSSLSQWSTAKIRRQLDFPTAACIERGRKLAAHLSQLRRGCARRIWARWTSRATAAALRGERPRPSGAALYLDTRWVVRQLVFANPLLGFRPAAVRQTVHAGNVSRRLPEPHALGVAAGRRPLYSPPGRPGRQSVRRGRRSAGRRGDRVIARPDFPAQRRARPRPRARHGPVVGRDAASCSATPRHAAISRPKAGSTARQSYRLRRTEEPTHIFEIGIDGRGPAPADLRRVERPRPHLRARTATSSLSPSAAARRCSATSTTRTRRAAIST